ncbi:uncharacterized protein LOC128552912 [Mercenaria mercenaria]|uniref:uncharacterized protein LOC128552912 n=1 Tax=Mercenaria mercenaria TaxID=6596 RepID=UPI00234F03BB|nr:uncharacterized protein LOC128552912 [Mercenaria mercenaria]
MAHGTIKAGCKLKTNNEARRAPQIYEEINKRILGKFILSLCGNEGTNDGSNTAGLRRLLQLAISVTENEPASTLQNAEFKFYDDECNVYTLTSGYGENKFVFTFNEKLEPGFTVQRKWMLLMLTRNIRNIFQLSALLELITELYDLFNFYVNTG